MPTKLAKRRHQAFLSQAHRCYYCEFEMWEGSPDKFAIAYQLTLRQAKWLMCTAEHLEAKMDGGSNAQYNIVAACAFCNRARHRLKHPPAPEEMRRYVQKRLAKRLWNSLLFNRPPQCLL